MSQRGNIDYDQVRQAAREGNGTQFQMFSGTTPTNGHIAVFDANGNVTDGGTPGGGGAVSSVFGRTGAVVAASGDYTASQVTNAVDATGSYANPSWITSLAWSKITGAPATGVSSVFGRAGAVVAASGDYTAAQVTNAVDQTQAYANPSWITSLAWAKITGAPAAYVLPPATATLLGGVKIGSNVSVTTDGTISVPTSVIWVPYTGTGQAFAVQNMTRDGDWTMIANKNTTDRPAPQPSGTEEDLLPVWTPAALNARASYTVYNEWTVNTTGWVDQYGADILAQNIGALHAVTLTVNGVTKDTFTAAPDTAGTYWHDITPIIVPSGAVLRVTVQVTQVSNNQMFWYQSPGLFSTLPPYCSSAVGSKDGAAAGTTAYACHLIFIPGTSSPDWDVVAFGGTGGAVDAVLSVFGRTGAVVAASGDYTAALVTNAVDQTQAYANPSWITSLAWAKITGAPSVGSYQTPWLQNINGANYSLSNAGNIGIGAAASATYGLDVQAPQATARVYSTAAGNYVYGAYAAGGNNTLMVGVESSVAGTLLTGSSAYAAFVNSDSNHPLQFAVNNTVYATITSAGNVGIQTSSPAYSLDISGDCNVTGAYRVNGTPIGTGGQPQTPWAQNINAANYTLTSVGSPLAVGNTGATLPDANADVHLLVGAISGSAAGEITICANQTANNAGLGMFQWANYAISGTEKRVAILSSYLDGATNSGGMIFSTAAAGSITERMRITSSGAVGIGTSNPGYPLSVAGDCNITGAYRVNGSPLTIFWQAGSGGAIYYNGGAVGIGSSTPGATLQVGAGTPLAGGIVDVYGANRTLAQGTALLNILTTDALAIDKGGTLGLGGVGSGNPYAFAILAGRSENNGYAGYLQLSTVTYSGSVTERMRITSGGNVGIGTSNPGAQLDLSTDSARKLSTTTWATGSDYRIKENIRPLEGGLAIINQLRPIEAELNGLGGTVKGTRTVSLIAQEAMHVLPDTVTVCRRKLYEDDEYDTDLLDFNPHEILFHLILAVQQLSKKEN